MKVAFVILAYKNPTQIRILVEHLIHPEHFFFVHIDKRIEVKPFKEELKKFGNKIFWVKRETSYWGSYQCVKALINGIQQALLHKDIRFEYFIHLSGQDFPLKSAEYINRTLARKFSTNYINVIPFPVSTWENGGFDRLNHIKFFWMGRKIILHSKLKNLVVNSIYSILSALLSFLSKDITFYGGEFYFMLNRSGVECLLSNISKHPILFNRLKFVTLPEEIIIQTMLMIDSDVNKLLISEDKFRFIDWRTNEKSPKEFDEDQILGMQNSPYLFGRKFTINNPNFKLNFDE